LYFGVLVPIATLPNDPNDVAIGSVISDVVILYAASPVGSSLIKIPPPVKTEPFL